MSTQALRAYHPPILAGLARGDTAAQIADRTGRSYHTVKNRVCQLRTDLGAPDAAALVDLAYRRGWLAGLRPEPRPPVALSARQQQALECIAAGQTNEQIACAWGVGLTTVIEHVGRLYAALEARTRAHAVALGHQHGHLTTRAHLTAA